MRTHLFAAASLLALAATPALAASPAPAENPSAVTDVSEAIVTATRLPAEARDEPSVRVIDSAEIEARQAVFAADILSTVPGLSLSRNGAFGGITSVRMRGASADKTLVVIDGLPQNDPSSPSGGYDFGSLDLADVARIEILSGPQGSLWGSDAIGGVIAITTRETDGWRANAEAGSFGSVRGSAAVGHREDGWALGASVSGYKADGVSRADGFPEKDGQRSWTAGVNGRLDVNSAVSLDGRVRYNDSRVDIDGYDPVFFTFGDTNEYATSKSWTGFGRATVQGPWGFTHELSLSAYDLKRASLGGGFPSSYTAQRQVWRWTARYGAPADALGLIVGAEQEDIRASLSSGDKQKAGATSAFAVVRYRPVEGLTLTGSLRVDDPKQYAATGTGRIAAVWDIAGGFSLQGSFGQGFKTPTISETACDFCFPAGPSTNLRPERANGWDLGLGWRSEDGRFDGRVIGYRLAVRDQISYGIGRYLNIDRTLTNGVEADLTARLTDQLTLKAGYAWTDATDRSTGARLLRVPENSGSVALLWAGERLSGSLTVRGESSQADSDPSTFSPATRKGFVVAGLAGGWKLTDKVELTARIENLADTHYQESLGYGEAGRGVFVGIRLRD
jgi:vitamin B12 transporter